MIIPNAAALMKSLLVAFKALIIPDSRAPRAVTQKPAQPSSSRGELVIDVDAGIDDAVALLMVLGHERRLGETSVGKVSAITCSHGNTKLSNVIRNVFRTLHAVNRTDVPVYSGASRSLLYTPPSDDYFGTDGFGDVLDEKYANATPCKEHAVNALVRTVRQNPGKVTLLCLGPLTNVALAERMHEGFISKLKDLVVLGGSVEGHGNVKPGVEFNAYMDPEAFAIVLEASQAAKRPLLLMPWETVFKRVRMSLEWRRNVLGALDSDAIRFMNLVERRSLGSSVPATTPSSSQVEDSKGQGWWPAADAVATAVVLDPVLATSVTNPLFVQVDTGLGSGRATQQVDYGNITGQTPNARIVMDVDVEGLKRMLLETLA